MIPLFYPLKDFYTNILYNNMENGIKYGIWGLVYILIGVLLLFIPSFQQNFLTLISPYLAPVLLIFLALIILAIILGDYAVRGGNLFIGRVDMILGFLLLMALLYTLAPLSVLFGYV